MLLPLLNYFQFISIYWICYTGFYICKIFRDFSGKHMNVFYYNSHFIYVVVYLLIIKFLNFINIILFNIFLFFSYLRPTSAIVTRNKILIDRSIDRSASTILERSSVDLSRHVCTRHVLDRRPPSSLPGRPARRARCIHTPHVWSPTRGEGNATVSVRPPHLVRTSTCGAHRRMRARLRASKQSI